MTTVYRIDPAQSRFTIHADATGLLSLMAHSPTFAARSFHGHLHLEDGEPGRMSLELVVKADSLVLVDRVSAADRRDIEGRMRGEVLETSHHPEIRFECGEIAAKGIGPDHFRLHMNGWLLLRGVSQPQSFDGEMRIFRDGIHLMGGCSLSMSRFQIRPVTALGGAIKLKDELKLSSELVALPEGS